MSAVMEIGEVARTDADGFLVGVARRDRMVSPWLEAAQAAAAAYVEHFGERVHSIYVRGSVARGRALEGISDIDSFVVLEGDDPIDFTWAPAFRAAHARQFPFCAGVELVALRRTQLLDHSDADNASWRMVVKTQSVCLWGDDLAGALPAVRPGPDAVVHAPYVRGDIAKFANGLRLLRAIAALPLGLRVLDRLGVDHRRIVRDGCQGTMKRIVRSGFETVMAAEGAYTRDLYPCYRIFSAHHPDREPEMRRALELAVAPSSDYREVLPVLRGLGRFVAEEAERQFGAPRDTHPVRAALLPVRKLFTSISFRRETQA